MENICSCLGFFFLVNKNIGIQIKTMSIQTRGTTYVNLPHLKTQRHYTNDYHFVESGVSNYRRSEIDHHAQPLFHHAGQPCRDGLVNLSSGHCTNHKALASNHCDPHSCQTHSSMERYFDSPSTNMKHMNCTATGHPIHNGVNIPKYVLSHYELGNRDGFFATAVTDTRHFTMPRNVPEEDPNITFQKKYVAAFRANASKNSALVA
jgi:hypothetical protein